MQSAPDAVAPDVPVARAPCGRTPPALRLLRPLSGERASGARPTFRWVAPASEPVRVTLCADRACARVLVEGEGRGGAWIPPRALRPGAVFWRVSTRDGARSATRALEVPTSAMPAGCMRAVVDFDGDGVEDTVTAAPLPRLEVRVRHSGAGLAERVFTAEPEVPATRSPCAPGRRVEALSLVAAGDVDGDGFTDAMLREARVETRCPEGDPLRAWRFGLIAGGPRGLSAEVRWSAEERTQNAWEAVRVEPAGDLDDDGYADLLLSRTSELLSRCTPVFGARALFGAEGMCLTPSEARMTAPAGAVAVCDLDGDGVEEVAAYDRDGTFALYRATERRLRLFLAPTSCQGEALRFFDRCIPGVMRPEADLRLLGDLNGDGLMDVESPLFDTPDARAPRGTVTFFGGGGGLREDRCRVQR